MAPFSPIGFYDLSGVFAGYTGKHKRALVESPSARHKGVRWLDLLHDKEQSPTLVAWVGAQAFVQKVNARLAELPAPSALVNAYVCAFDPDGFEAWEVEDTGLMCAHVLLNPAPAFRLLCGSEAAVPAPWQALMVDHRLPRSRTNFNAPNTAHVLTFEFTAGTAG
jgi:hypothetical protein